MLRRCLVKCSEVEREKAGEVLELREIYSLPRTRWLHNEKLVRTHDTNLAVIISVKNRVQKKVRNAWCDGCDRRIPYQETFLDVNS